MFHILVVDDDKNTRRLLGAVLETENYVVFSAENGEDALRGERGACGLTVAEKLVKNIDDRVFQMHGALLGIF